MEDDKSINILNESCLSCIFEYLPFKDRVKIERVSKLWRKVALKSWTKFQSLSTGYQDYNLDNEQFLHLLKRCGPYLRRISLFSENNDGDHYKLLLEIPSHCKNLRSLEVAPLMSEITFHSLCENFDEIRELDVYFEKDVSLSTEDFSKLLASKRKLRKLKLYNVESLDFPVPETVQDLTLRAKVFEQSLSPKLFQNLKHLYRLQIGEIKVADLLPIFTQTYAKTLTYLDLRYISGDFRTVKHLSLLENLQVLTLVQCHSITDKDVKEIVENCQGLKEFILNHCRLTTSKSLESIANLTNLEILIFRQHVKKDPNLNNHFRHLRKLKNLKQLAIKSRNSIGLFRIQSPFKSFTNNIDDETVCDVIRAISNLQRLVLSGFDFTRNDFRVLRFAEEITKKRSENVLEILCEENMPNFYHESSFLLIENIENFKF